MVYWIGFLPLLVRNIDGCMSPCPMDHEGSLRVGLALDFLAVRSKVNRQPPDYSSNLCPPKTCAI